MRNCAAFCAAGFVLLLASGSARSQNGELVLSPTNGPPGRALSVSAVGLPLGLTGQVATITFQGNLMFTQTLVACDAQVGGAGFGLACDGGPISFIIPAVPDGSYAIAASTGVGNPGLQAVFQVGPDFQGDSFAAEGEPSFEVTGATNPIINLTFGVQNDYDVPPVPEGRFVPRHHSRTQAVRQPNGPTATSPRPLDLPGPVKVMRNTSLGTQVEGFIGYIPEPTAAAVGRVSMLTFNSWGGAFSTDCGETFQILDARRISSQTKSDGTLIDGGMNGDQHVVYAPAIDRFIWLIQFNPCSSCTPVANRYRLMVASPATIVSSSGKSWSIFDLTSADLGLSTWMDYPGLAVGPNYLYLSANPIGSSMIVRIPLAALTAPSGTKPTVTVYNTSALGEFRLVQNCGARQFWVNRPKDNTVRIFYWDEGDPSSKINWNDYLHPSSPWPNNNSLTPDGFNWLAWGGPPGGNISSATMAGNEIWVAWNAGRDPSAWWEFLYPDRITQERIDIARFDATTFALLDYFPIWWPDYSYAYGYLCSTVDGDVGMSFLWGGNSKYYPNHAVGFVSGTADLVNTTGSTASVQRCGDYLSLRRHYPDGRWLVAAGNAIWSRPLPKQYTHDPHYVLFGRGSLPGPTCLRWDGLRPDGFELRLSGVTGDPFTIEASTDQFHWSALYQGTFQSNTFDFLDQAAGNFPARFYRTASPAFLGP